MFPNCIGPAIAASEERCSYLPYCGVMKLRWQKQRFDKTDYVSSVVKDTDVITKMADRLLTSASYSSTQTKCVFF